MRSLCAQAGRLEVLSLKEFQAEQRIKLTFSKLKQLFKLKHVLKLKTAFKLKQMLSLNMF